VLIKLCPIQLARWRQVHDTQFPHLSPVKCHFAFKTIFIRLCLPGSLACFPPPFSRVSVCQLTLHLGAASFSRKKRQVCNIILFNYFKATTKCGDNKNFLCVIKRYLCTSLGNRILKYPSTPKHTSFLIFTV